MKISTRGRYGMRAIEVLTENYNQGPIPIRAISEEKNISMAYLEQLFSALRKNNLVTSVRGAKGGYELARSPEEISVGEVLAALEGEVKLHCCGEDGMPTCAETEPCRTHDILVRIENAIDDFTYNVKLADI